MPFTPYLNVEEIESALEAAAAHPALCQLITLPNTTFEGRTSHAVRIAAGAMTNRKGVLLIGGAHAREWGSSDILVAFMENLIAAYESNTGLTFQAKAYTALEIRRIVESLDLFIFPDMNPDGKAYCQAGTDWRKNRRPVAGAVGVDVNRNYDLLWDANLYFDPTLDFSYLYSPSSGTYHGPSPFSEAESQNVRWLLDTYPQIAYFVDFHCYGQKVMCVWGDDENQSTEADKAFNNAAYNGQRGRASDAYSEFIFADDHQKQLRAAQRMRDAVFAVRGQSYTVGQIFHQVGVSAGDSAPYVFSRHITDGLRRKVFSFGVEWGQSFQPVPSEMLLLMDDIGAAVAELCLCAAEPDLYVRDYLGDSGREPSSGGLSTSLDIIVRKDPVADPAAAFANPAVDPGSDKVEIGNDNYIYVRVHNQGGQVAEAAVRVYFAPLTTSCAPASWTFIDEVSIPVVPAGGFAVGGPVVWPHVPDPGTAGHFCLIALCGNTLDPFPDPSMVDSASDFIRWMRNGNNQAYRNIAFEDVRPDGWAAIPFAVHGFGRREELFEFEFDATRLPPGGRVEVKAFPEALKEPRTMKTRGMTPLRSNQRGTHFLIREGKRGILENVRIPRPRAPRFVVHVRLSERAEPGARHLFSVVQRWNGRDIGRISIHLCRPK
jgi:carboxypeptidase T